MGGTILPVLHLRRIMDWTARRTPHNVLAPPRHFKLVTVLCCDTLCYYGVNVSQDCVTLDSCWGCQLFQMCLWPRTTRVCSVVCVCNVLSLLWIVRKMGWGMSSYIHNFFIHWGIYSHSCLNDYMMLTQLPSWDTQPIAASIILGLERYQAQHPIPNTLASNDTNTQYQYQYGKWRHLCL